MARKDREPEALKKAPRASGSALSEEERELWERAASDLQPLKVKPQRVTGAPAQTPAPSRIAPDAPDAKSRVQPHRPPPAARVPVTPPSPPVPPLAEVDRRKARRVGSGRVEIDARIDLHGMTQSEAHSALRRFLLAAHADGRRWVLVITGKGAPLDRSLNRSMAPLDGSEGAGDEPRGVLRRNVPFWLAEPELRSIVIGFTTAAIRHGGEGALYVQLRKRAGDAGA